MKIEHAKAILLSYRATGADVSDPAFVEALELARRDPELQAWFERQQRFDRGMMTEVEAIHVPGGLRDAILAAAEKQTANNEAAANAKDARAGHVAAGTSESRSAPVPTMTQTWWSWSTGIGIGIAAAIALLASATVTFWPKPKVSAVDSSLAAFAVVDAQNPKTHGGHGEDAKELNRTLNTTTTHLGDALPIDFQALHDTGCRTVHVEGRDVLEMCFRRNGVQFHCYIARRNDFPLVTAPTAPIVSSKNGAGVATWEDKANLYIVVSKPGPAPLEKLL